MPGLGGPPGRLAGTLDVDLDHRRVAASFVADVGLRDLLAQLPAGSQAVLAWIPNIGIAEADLDFTMARGEQALVAYIVAGIAGSPANSASLLIATLELPASLDRRAGANAPPSTAAVVGLGLRSTADLSGTPLFGSMLSGISIQNLGVRYASRDLPAGTVVIPTVPPTELPAIDAGLALTLTIAGGGATKTFSLEPSAKKPPNAPADVVAVGDDGGGPPLQWFSFQQSFGPLTLGRLGLLTSSDRFGLGLDASIQTSAFSVVLTGFMVSFPTDRIDLADTHVQLDGLSLSFTSPSLAIAGSLVRTESAGITSYDGAVLIQLGQFGIAAVGSYAELQGSASLFIYGMAKGSFGGPPAFFVTGIAAGFGYNRGLRLPTPETVADHPFIRATQDGAGFTEALQMLTTGGWVPPALGEHWLAAGVQFTTFELLHSFVLASVQFGDELVFALLGLSSLTLPQAGETYAYAELTLDAVLRPAAGTLQVTALLTASSFVLDRACHLTGGFAFWLWFGPSEHAGDFAVTLGGYHPLFEPPPWYPSVPRLGFDWQVSDAVHVTGGAYFALTPSCVMAGGSLALTYQSGDLRAWFTAHLDTIVYWNPFYFVAGIGLSLGASYTLNLGTLHRTFTVELGVDLELWGPPVAGVARVNWFIISFSVAINDGGQPSPPGRTLKDWGTFAAAFLPAAEPSSLAADTRSTICRPRVARGLRRTIDDGTVWVVAANDLVLETETVVPATEVLVGGADHPSHRFTGPAAGVYPMGSVDLRAAHIVEVDRVPPDGGTEPLDLGSWQWAPTTGRQPGSLWGRVNTGQAELGADTVPVLGGCRGAPTPVELTGPGPISFSDLAYAPLHDRDLPLPTTPPIDGSTMATLDPFGAVERTVMQQDVVATRDAVVAELVRLDVGSALVGGDLSALRADIEATFAAPPMIGPLGCTGPRSDQPPAGRAVAAPARGRRWRRPPPERPSPVLRAGYRRGAPRTGSRSGEGVGARLWAAVTAGAAGYRPLARPGAVPREAHRGGATHPIAADTTAVWMLDPGRAHALELWGPARRLLALDAQEHALLDELVAGGPLVLPAGTATVVLDEDGGRRGDRRPVGWRAPHAVRRLGAHTALGDEVLVRTQAPAPAGRTSAADLVAANQVVDAAGHTTAGWVGTTLPAGRGAALISVAAGGGSPLVRVGRGRRPRTADLVTVTEPVASLDEDGERHLLIGLDGDGPAHVYVTAETPLIGVAAFVETPSRLLASGPALEVADLGPAPGASTLRWVAP